MDPWSFGSEGKDVLFSDEMDFPFDALARTRKALMEFDTIPSYGFENDGIVSGEGVENDEFMEFDFTDIMGTYGGEVGSDASKQVSSNCIFTPNSSFGEIECNSHDFSLIDLKLGRLDACNDADIDFSKERSVLSSGLSKRPRTNPSSYYHTPFCQVQGCNMNLSSSKDYHKRHKVCDAHSKTSRVIVNGIEQRFCQQCSRFHLLAEFDDGKRSCRKRLVGHNERRRKPYIDSFSSRSNKFLHSIQGSRLLGGSFPKRLPFIFPDRYRETNRCQQIIKFDEESLTVPRMNRTMLAKSFPRLQHYVQELPGSSNSSSALSLLSTQISGTTLSSSFSNPIGIDQIAPIMHPSIGHASDSGFSYSKQRLAPRQGTTVDLLQLSSHLQRVEQHRSYVQVKQENDDFFSFLAT